MTAGVERHNRVVPEVLTKIIEDAAGEADAMVVLESVILGVLLYYRPNPRQAAEYLDELSRRVIGRMPA